MCYDDDDDDDASILCNSILCNICGFCHHVSFMYILHMLLLLPAINSMANNPLNS